MVLSQQRHGCLSDAACLPGTINHHVPQPKFPRSRKPHPGRMVAIDLEEAGCVTVLTDSMGITERFIRGKVTGDVAAERLLLGRDCNVADIVEAVAPSRAKGIKPPALPAHR